VSTDEKPYLPAAGSDWLLPFYDMFTRLTGVRAAHRRLLEQAALQPGYRILEIGCGTGNLAILARRLNPSVEVLGIDPDPKALSRARRKAQRAGFPIEFREAFAEQLPFPDASFDRVLSAFMLHHVLPDAKIPTLREALRVLKPRGSLHLLDFEAGEHPRGFSFRRLLHPHARSHAHGRHHTHHGVPDLMQEAGFADPARVAGQDSLLGAVAYYSASRPPGTDPVAA
jgi:ubiquinone/menaquinone biosynthesis C-methylase UbiE